MKLLSKNTLAIDKILQVHQAHFLIRMFPPAVEPRGIKNVLRVMSFTINLSGFSQSPKIMWRKSKTLLALRV